MVSVVIAFAKKEGKTRLHASRRTRRELSLAMLGDVLSAAVAVGAVRVVTADVPCALPADLRALLAATPAGGIALAEALDGTTNALSIPAADVFAPLYGPDSAARFRARAGTLGL